MQRQFFILATLLKAFLGVALAQSAGGSAKQYEVASIKASPAPPPNRFGFPVRPTIRFGSDGRLDTTQATLFDLMLSAFDIQDFRLIGGPAWIKSTRFDVVAQAPERFQGDGRDMREMLQALLRERFGLQTRIETRELPVFRLVLANRDGKLGALIRPSGIDCRQFAGPEA